MMHFYEFEVIDEETGMKIKKDILLTLVCEISEAIVTEDIEITEDSKFHISKNRSMIGMIDGAYYIVCKSKDAVRAIMQSVLEGKAKIPVNFYQESNEPLNKSDNSNDNNDRF